MTEEQRIKFIANLKSLAKTQKEISSDYHQWAMDRGEHAAYYSKEAKRLLKESIKNATRAAKEEAELS